MVGHCGAPSTGQQSQAMVESCREVVHAKRFHAAGGQFNGERYAIEMSADRGDRREFVSARREAQVQRIYSLDEELYRAVAQEVVWCLLSESGNIEWRNTVDLLTFDPRHFTTGHEHRRVWTHANEVLDRAGRRVDDVLATSSTSRTCFAPTARATASAVSSPGSFSLSALAAAGDTMRPDRTKMPARQTIHRRRSRKRVHGLSQWQAWFFRCLWARECHDLIGRDKVPHMPRGRFPTNQAPGDQGEIVLRWGARFAHLECGDRRGRRAVLPRRPTPKQAIASTGDSLKHGLDPRQALCGSRIYEPGACFRRPWRPAICGP